MYKVINNVFNIFENVCLITAHLIIYIIRPSEVMLNAII